MAEWYYTRNNQQMGPVSWDELRQLASTGLLHPTDMVWKEGMVDWQRSGKVDGLHGDRAASRRDDADDRPRRRRDRDDYDDDYDDRPRRRRRSSEGMPLGAKVAIIGGSIAVGLLVLVIVIVVLVRGGSGGGVLGPNDYQVTLFPGQSDTRSFFFQAGQNVRITVTSQTDMRTDIDLFVERANGFPVASDTRISKDCFVAFVAPVAENYRVRVVNLPGNRNRAVCTVNIR
jgi:GYF domain 2